MRITDIRNYIQAHYAEFPNFDERTIDEILAELPDQDERYDQGEDGLASILNDLPYIQG